MATDAIQQQQMFCVPVLVTDRVADEQTAATTAVIFMPAITGMKMTARAMYGPLLVLTFRHRAGKPAWAEQRRLKVAIRGMLR